MTTREKGQTEINNDRCERSNEKKSKHVDRARERESPREPEGSNSNNRLDIGHFSFGFCLFGVCDLKSYPFVCGPANFHTNASMLAKESAPHQLSTFVRFVWTEVGWPSITMGRPCCTVPKQLVCHAARFPAEEGAMRLALHDTMTGTL